MKRMIEIVSFDEKHLAPGDHAFVRTEQGYVRTSSIIRTTLGTDGSIAIETRNSFYVKHPCQTPDRTVFQQRKPVYRIVGCEINSLDEGRAVVRMPDGSSLRTSEIQKFSMRNGIVYLETKNSIYTNEM